MRELLRGGYTGSDLRESGCSVWELHTLLTPQQLCDAGFLPTQLLQHGLSLRVLYECGVGACDLSACGCSCCELLASGYDVRSLWGGGFTVQQLQAAGCSSQQLQAAELPAAALWDSGLFSAGDMKAAGYSCEQLQQLGWSERGEEGGPRVVSANLVGKKCKLPKTKGDSDARRDTETRSVGPGCHSRCTPAHSAAHARSKEYGDGRGFQRFVAQRAS